jgi:hypothetical protein
MVTHDRCPDQFTLDEKALEKSPEEEKLPHKNLPFRSMSYIKNPCFSFCCSQHIYIGCTILSKKAIDLLLQPNGIYIKRGDCGGTSLEENKTEYFKTDSLDT